jgi:hypothetical protein
MVIRRRVLLGLLIAGVGSACVPVSPRLEATPGLASSPAVDEWRASALAMIGDALTTLRTFDSFAAYRVSVTPSSALRTPSILAWDPPTGAAWDDATHVSRGLHDRANQLFLAITTARIDASLWRTQREMADATHDVIDLGDALRAYRDRIDRLPPGDASGALDLLDRAWARWDAIAVRWQTGRAEAIGGER